MVNDTPKGMALLKQADDIEAAFSQRQLEDNTNIRFFTKVSVWSGATLSMCIESAAVTLRLL